jgi:peptidyl-prolyl cis-trans isomerase A (cyclophilin A)
MGTIIARLLPQQAPQAVAYFVGLSQGDLEWSDPVTGEKHREPFYDGTRVHYSRAGLTFEVGRVSGSGAIAPLLYVPMEDPGPVNFFSGGRLGLGRSPLGRISAVIFFVTVSAQPWLNQEHPCFGEIVIGEEVARGITEVKTYNNGRPIDDVRIEAIRVFKVGEPAPLPEPEPYYPTQATPTPIK